MPGVICNALSDIPRVGVRGAGGPWWCIGNSGFEDEAAGGVAVASDGRRGVECLLKGVGARRTDGVSMSSCGSCSPGFTVIGDGVSAIGSVLVDCWKEYCFVNLGLALLWCLLIRSVDEEVRIVDERRLKVRSSSSISSWYPSPLTR